MTKKEMTEIFSVMMLAWPNAEMFKGGIQKLGPTITLWTTCLPEVDFWTAQQVTVKLCRVCKFPPTIAEFKEQAEAVQEEIESAIETAFQHLRWKISSGKTPQECFDAMPDGSLAKMALISMGSPDAIMVTIGDTEMFNRSGFREAYYCIIRRSNTLKSTFGTTLTHGLQMGEEKQVHIG